MNFKMITSIVMIPELLHIITLFSPWILWVFFCSLFLCTPFTVTLFSLANQLQLLSAYKRLQLPS